MIESYTDFVGTKRWRKCGKLHRDDGPAVIDANGTKLWFRNGKEHRDGDKPAVEDANGTKRWFKNGKLHRDGDTPVIICENGNRWWFKDGELHRDDDKPAIEYKDGLLAWYKEGVLYMPNWNDVHTRIAIKISVLNLPMLILIEIASRILHNQYMDTTGLTDYQVTEIISAYKNENFNQTIQNI